MRVNSRHISITYFINVIQLNIYNIINEMIVLNSLNSFHIFLIAYLVHTKYNYKYLHHGKVFIIMISSSWLLWYSALNLKG